MPVDNKTYKQYLGLRNERYYPTTALEAWRQIKYQITQQVKRKLSPTYAAIVRLVDPYKNSVEEYKVAGLTFKIEVHHYDNFDTNPYEGIGEIEYEYVEDSDRNDEYWKLDSKTIFTPNETWVDHYRYYLPKWGKAKAAQMAYASRKSEMKWVMNTFRDGVESEITCTLIDPDGDEDMEFFYLDDLTSIYDWVASKIDSQIAQRQRQAA